MQQMVTAEQAMSLLAALVVSLKELAVEYVDEDRRRPYLVAVQRQLDRFAGAGAGAADHGDGG